MKTIDFNSVLPDQWKNSTCVLLWYENTSGGIRLLKMSLNDSGLQLTPGSSSVGLSRVEFFPDPVRRGLLIVPDKTHAYIVNVFDGRAFYYVGVIANTNITKIRRVHFVNLELGTLVGAKDFDIILGLADWAFLIEALKSLTTVEQQYK